MHNAPTTMRKKNVKEFEELAADIMKFSANTLLINLRFMESAFINIAPDGTDESAEMSTDGKFLYYDPSYICKLFRKEKNSVTRNYLHIVLHCVFSHFFVGEKIRKNIWNLACDIAVENIITGFHIKSLFCEREEEQAWFLKELNEEIPKMTAEIIYRYIIEHHLTNEDIIHLQRLFYADEHSRWYAEKKQWDGNQKRDRKNGEDETNDNTNDLNSQENSDNESSDDNETESIEGSLNQTVEISLDTKGDGNSGKSGGESKPESNQPMLAPEDLKQKWKDISERIQLELDTFSNTYGSGSGDMIQNLREVNRERYDYSEFLKKFSTIGENIQVNDDEFDYIFYDYGMKLYKKMPLIEPLEYKEVKRVREFVIALDTSESVSGELIQLFVQKTWNLMKQSENYFTKVNVHIIQCGAKVEEDAKITSQEEFDSYMLRMVLHGFGGTDFRPVFSYVDSLIKQHEFLNLKGLIYFTDGFETYPAMPPSYETAFVFIDRGNEIPKVPAWALKVILKEEDISEF